MSIYFVKGSSFTAKVEAFEQRGLSGMVSSKAQDAGIYAVEKANWALKAYYDNLAGKLRAVRTGKLLTLSLEADTLGDYLKPYKYFPFEAPLLCVEMKSGGSILNAYGLYETGTSKLTLFAGSPNLEQLAGVLTQGLDLYTTVPAGNVNLAGYLAWIYAWRGINAFFDLGGGCITELETKFWIGEQTAEGLQGSPATMEVKDAAGRITQRAQPEKKAGGAVTASKVGFLVGSKTYGDCSHYIVGTDFTAEAPGFLFEYFREMLEADPDGPFNIFLRFYRSCLGNTIEEQTEAMTMLRRGFRYLSNSQPGKVIQHIYHGMQMAVQLGADLRLIRDGGRYAGFILMKEGIQIINKARVREAATAADLTNLVASLNTHQQAVEKLISMLESLETMDGGDGSINREQALINPRVLREAAMRRHGYAVEELRKEISENVSKLKYAQDYWPITPENLLRFFLAMAGNLNFHDQPLFVSVETLLNRNSEVLPYLAVFGRQAPSIHYGNKVLAVAPLDKEDPNLQLVGKKRKLPYIPYELQGLTTAAASWASAKKSRSLKFLVGKSTREGALQGAKDRAGMVTDPHFDALYSALRQWFYSEHEVLKTKKGKGVAKRGADDMEEPEEAPAKKAKSTLSWL